MDDIVNKKEKLLNRLKFKVWASNFSPNVIFVINGVTFAQCKDSTREEVEVIETVQVR